jgi:hypothetical protein
MIGEMVGESIVEGITGSDIDINGDSVTLTGEDGEEVTFGSTEWPDNEIIKRIPKFSKGEIETSYITDEGGSLAIINVAKADYDDYVEQIKQAGFTVDPQTMEADDLLIYTASDAENYIVSLSYAVENTTMSITIGKN